MAMANSAEFTVEDLPSGQVLRLSGTFAIGSIGDVDRSLREISASVSEIDISGITHMDTVGAWLVHRTAKEHNAKITGSAHDASRLIDAVSGVDQAEAIPKPPISSLYHFLAEVGGGVVVGIMTFLQFLGFVGQVVKAFFTLLMNPRRFRWHAVVQHFDMVGVRALGIVGLMSFLIGILMTAIMVAGRSGSAFAAQIGTMKITEEIDAMRTIGVVPVEALVVPRVIAAVVMMPLLGIFASLMSIIGGGLLCWIVLDIPPATFVQRLREVTPMTDFWIGMIKAPVFGAIIAMAGCFQGMQVKGNAEQVGLKTTAAVVQAIFLVIVLDAFFAVFFSEIGWD